MKEQEKEVNSKKRTEMRFWEHMNRIIFTIISNTIKTLKFPLQEIFLFEEIGEWEH